MARRDLDDWLWQVGAELQRLSEEMSPSSPVLAKSHKWQPRMDVIEADDALIVTAEIAGVRTEDFRIVFNTEKKTLTLKGVRCEETRNTRMAHHQLEIYYGDFERELRLPELDYAVADISASYHNGFLTICIPKSGHANRASIITGTIRINHR